MALFEIMLILFAGVKHKTVIRYHTAFCIRH